MPTAQLETGTFGTLQRFIPANQPSGLALESLSDDAWLSSQLASAPAARPTRRTTAQRLSGHSGRAATDDSAAASQRALRKPMLTIVAATMAHFGAGSPGIGRPRGTQPSPRSKTHADPHGP